MAALIKLKGKARLDCGGMKEKMWRLEDGETVQGLWLCYFLKSPPQLLLVAVAIDLHEICNGLHGGIPHPSHPPSIAKAAAGWLSHAGPSTPLNLSVVDMWASRLPGDDFLALCNLIVRHQPRWKHLSFDVDGDARCLSSIFLQAPSNNWVNLGSLVLSIYRSPSGSQSGFTQVLRRILPIQPAPLQELSLRACSSSIQAGLTDVALIASFTHLQRLRLVLSNPLVQRPSDPSSVSFPSLTSLSLETLDLALLQYLDTPSLSELDIHPKYIVQGTDDTILRKFLIRCSHMLSINIGGNDEHIALLLPILSTRPTVTSVGLAHWPAMNNVTWEDTWCPKLQELTVDIYSRLGPIANCDREMESLRRLSMFLLRRNEAGRGLHRLVFRNIYRARGFPYELFENLGVVQLDVMFLQW
ncbi:hypothetical protein BKA70DRAFT_1409680 [Coprinopsis sp. MPI-PUGE-AT-0042]|nr:hypothetical protein BKA70DRAFT_1409680 [Coprinopsis sp. MPI-PUGE-AT-0042]